MTTRLDPQNYGSPFDGIGGRDRTAPMLILDTFTIRGRGLVIAGYPAAEPLQGGTVTAPDGRRWTVAACERRLTLTLWRPGEEVGILLTGPAVPLPVVGETVTIEAVEASQR